MKRLTQEPSRVAAETLLRSVAKTPRRDGATLAEILISLMVMSIGVVSLATLFPISVLRSIQASQLTNATIHRLNAEQLIGLFPRLVHDPNADGNIAQHELQIGSGGLDNPLNANDGVNEGRFIVDPLGATYPNYSVAVRSVFGNDSGAAPATYQINRYNGLTAMGSLSAAAAASFDYLPDSWQLAAKGNVTTSTTTSITVPAGIDLATSYAALNATTPVRVRVVLYSQNGRQSLIRETGIAINTAANTISWTDAVPTNVPPFYVDTDSNGIPDTLTFSRFRLEIYDTRYSWLLTVRKTPGVPLGQGSANVDVVVFHKRAFSEAAEQIFTVQSWIGTTCILDLTSAPAGTRPFLKKGSFLFDAQHAHWYRITQLKNETTTAPTITLDRSVIAPVDTNGNQVHPNRVMAVPGIVEVYPIGSISFDPNNTP